MDEGIDLFTALFYYALLPGSTAFLQLWFLRGFTGVRERRWVYAPFLAAVLALSGIQLAFSMGQAAVTALEIALLFCAARFALKGSAPLSLVAALIAQTVPYLVTGMLNSFFAPLMRRLLLTASSNAVILCASALMCALALGLAYITFRVALRQLRDCGVEFGGPAAALFFPVLLILLVSLLISGSIYGNVLNIDHATGEVSPRVDDLEMFFIQLVAYICFLAVLYAYRRLTDYFRMKTRLALLERDAGAQRAYIEEAGQREARTRAFRHDLKNHLLVLDGLLGRGDYAGARSYLSNLEGAADFLSYPCHTGDAALDVLLGEKLGRARQQGVRVECSASIPAGCSIDSMDLCIVFANALDNALKAAARAGGEPKISVTTRLKGNFLLLCVENTLCPEADYPKGAGIGLSSIRAVAEKYGGAVETSQSGGLFRMNALFAISRQ